MRISILIGGEPVGVFRAPEEVVAEAVAAEQDGFTSAWCIHFSRGIDSMTMLAAAAQRTSRIELGVGVVPTYPRHPVALAQSAATVQSLSGGRFVLGVGVSHRPVIEGMHGLDYSSQVGHLREYLTVLGRIAGRGRGELRRGSLPGRGGDNGARNFPRAGHCGSPGAGDVSAGRGTGRRGDHMVGRTEVPGRGGATRRHRGRAGGGEGLRPAWWQGFRSRSTETGTGLGPRPTGRSVCTAISSTTSGSSIAKEWMGRQI